MRSPEICASITSVHGIEEAVALREYVSLYEVRIDLVGPAWREVARELPHPWIACNRVSAEGGKAVGDESERIAVLKEAIDAGASIVDIELRAEGLSDVVSWTRGRASVLISYHDLLGTPAPDALEDVLTQERAAGADINKIVTTATKPGDGVAMLQFVARHRDLDIVSFTMGPAGVASRVLAPLAGARFMYASLAEGSESAPGQLTVKDLHSIYGTLGVY